MSESVPLIIAKVHPETALCRSGSCANESGLPHRFHAERERRGTIPGSGERQGRGDRRVPRWGEPGPWRVSPRCRPRAGKPREYGRRQHHLRARPNRHRSGRPPRAPAATQPAAPSKDSQRPDCRLASRQGQRERMIGTGRAAAWRRRRPPVPARPSGTSVRLTLRPSKSPIAGWVRRGGGVFVGFVR